MAATVRCRSSSAAIMCKQDGDHRRRPRDLALSRRPMRPRCAAGGCSSFLPQRPLHRARPIFPTGGDATVINAPTARRRSANFRDFAQPADRFNFAPFNYHPDPARALRRVRQPEVGARADDINFSLKGMWNRRKSKNQAAPLPFDRPRRRQRQSARRDHDRRDQSVQPVRRDAAIRPAAQLRTLHPPALRRRRAAPLQPEGRHRLRRRPRSTASSTSRPRLVLGRQRRLRPATRPSRRCSATSTPNLRAGAGPGRRLHRRPACRSTSSAARARSPGDARLCRPSPSTTAASRRSGTSPPTCPASLSDLPGGPLGIAARRRISRSERPLRSRSGRRRRLQLRHSGAVRPRAATTSRRPMPSSTRRCSPTCRSSTCSSSTARPASPIIRPPARPRPSRAASTGSRSRTCASAAPMRRASARRDRRIVRDAVALRPDDQRSLLERQHRAAQTS